MEKIYFLAGLGSNEESTEQLNQELNKFGYEISFIDLPGQYSNVNTKINDENDFVEWLKENIPTNSILMAFSMGADLALKYNRILNAKKLIILDGGIIGYDFDGRNLEEDIEETRNIIKESKLNIDADTISSLIIIIENDYKDIFSVELYSDTLFLVADSPEYVFKYKKNKIERYIESKQDNICIKIIENTTHHLYIEKPKEISEEINKWLNKEE